MWICEICEKSNKSKREICSSCGNPRPKEWKYESKRSIRKKEAEYIDVRKPGYEIEHDTNEESSREITDSDYYKGSINSVSGRATNSTKSDHRNESTKKSKSVIKSSQSDKPDGNRPHRRIKTPESASGTGEDDNVDVELEYDNIYESKGKPVSLCEPCLHMKEKVPATKYCETCDEFYCTDCTASHNFGKSANRHDIVNVLTDSTNCESCKLLLCETVASHYCENCNEYLCAKCSAFHLATDELKSHKIIKIKAFMCAFCINNELTVKATTFCLDCNPENAQLFCDKCGKRHTAIKSFRDHRLSRQVSHFFTRLRQKHDKSYLETGNEVRVFKRQEEENDTVSRSIKKKQIRIEQPYVTEESLKSDEIDLKWKDNEHRECTEVYQITLREGSGKWKAYPHTTESERMTITGLRSSTVYYFRIRIKNEETGDDGFLSQTSDPIVTGKSMALKIKEKSSMIRRGCPNIYRLPIQENKAGKNELAKTRKFTLGKETLSPSKTIMIVGATGSGKSTLINAMANYVLGVKWEDDFRFELIHLDKKETAKQSNQALSQTEWVTCYTIYSCASNRTDYTINVIDTPGFGDCRGIDQDKRIVDQIRALFTSTGEMGIDALNAVCFILKAPDARLSVTQKYIFESILALFGNDIKENICTLITFADGNQPPVLAALRALKDNPLPINGKFLFNNSALFVDNSKTDTESLSPIFWQMGESSCKAFFSKLPAYKEKSLTLTAEVLISRQKLENLINSLQSEIDIGLSKINEIEEEIRIFNQNKREIEANKDFKYFVDEQRHVCIDISGKGVYTTHCTICNYTCHDNCAFKDNGDKAKCIAMDKTTGYCLLCPKYCFWEEHRNFPYVVKWEAHKVQRTYHEKLKKYEEAEKKKISLAQLLYAMHEENAMHEEIKCLESGVQCQLAEITDYTNKLKDIALRPDPLSIVEYIDLLIESEKREKKSGCAARIDTLEKCKRKAQIGNHVQVFNDRLKSITTTSWTCDKQENNSKNSRTLKKFKNLIFG